MFCMGPCLSLRRDLKISPFIGDIFRSWPKLWRKCLARARIFSCIEAGMLPNLVFSNEKKFDVQHHVNLQNDRVWSCDGKVGLQRVTRAQGAVSVMVWAAIIEPGKSPLVFIEQGIKLNQKNY